MDAMLVKAKDAIITVSSGRGFLIEARALRLVVTAAHCLPHLPPAHRSSCEQRTYSKLLGPLGATPSVWAECLFVDPIADVAVLGAPDYQEFLPEMIAYEDLVANRSALQIGSVTTPCPVWRLTLDGQWTRCTIRDDGWRWLSLADSPTETIAPGTSGSPIMAADGHAVGLIGIGGLLNPVLADRLPGWVLRRMLPLT
jgi:Trypsin-like peptidase domain